MRAAVHFTKQMRQIRTDNSRRWQIKCTKYYREENSMNLLLKRLCRDHRTATVIAHEGHNLL